LFAIGITDQSWFEFLRRNRFDGIINFWTPSPWKINRLTYGDGFYFFLKNPIRKIAGGGCFFGYCEMTIQEAWNRYENRNGCENFSGLKQIIREYKKNTLLGSQLLNHKIGCIELKNCKFLRNPRFISPSRFNVEIPKNMQTFKYFVQDDRFSEYIIEYGTDKDA
jgi:putative restriction endonuclease